jgi:hypothetical protein
VWQVLKHIWILNCSQFNRNEDDYTTGMFVAIAPLFMPVYAKDTA